MSTTLNCGMKKGGGGGGGGKELKHLHSLFTKKDSHLSKSYMSDFPLLSSITSFALFIVLYNINSSCKNPSVLPSNWHKFQANCDKNRPTAFIVDMENKRSHCR